ncbi:sensor domain-containing diguanylate cyclase [Vibrio fluminensis]|uniref:sensor domain-containing diguanylate cyclase n=1 Tax=Vibrio fluminensis TaxID=2783614 RepID=UPI0032AF478D
MKVEQNALLEGKKNYIEWVIGSVVKETALLADLLGQQKIYKSGTELDEQTKSQLLQHTSNALLAMSQRKEIYDQIRYLDLEGNEIVRVNFYDGKAHLIAKDELQNKAHRYYFQKALALGCNQVYVSPIDLNMEHGMIEVPHKPMIRMATPVVDEQGQKRGIVIINYLAKYLMDGLRLFNLDSGTNYMLINNSGYFLFNDERPDLEFAFMFEDKQDQTVYTMFPELAERIKTTVSGQLESETGIMTVESVGAIDRVNPYCFQDFHVSNNDTTSWKLVSYADFEKRIDVQHPTAFHGSMIQLGVLLSIVLALCIATYQLRLNRDDRRIHYLAHYDNLTGLYNRGAFQAKSLEAVKKANKEGNPVCLVFIDLDDFKSINDSYSHRGGDIALQHVAKAIQSVYGEQAIIGRIGGDEFAVLLHQSLIFEQAQQYADELLDVVKRPFEVEPDVKIQVSTSIGGHYCQDSCCDSDDLIHKADIAMYQAKAAGKGCVVILDCIDDSSQT